MTSSTSPVDSTVATAPAVMPTISTPNIPLQMSPSSPLTSANAMPANFPANMPGGAQMDPLAQLHDIQLPEMIHQYPIAPGWWALLIASVLLISYLAVKYYRFRKHCAVKNQAIANIKNNQLSDPDIVAVLKWAALAYFPRVDVANLYGEGFQRFLSMQLPEKNQQRFNELATDSMNNLYQENSQRSPALEQAALLWLNQALPTKLQQGLTNTLTPSTAKPSIATTNTVMKSQEKQGATS